MRTSRQDGSEPRKTAELRLRLEAARKFVCQSMLAHGHGSALMPVFNRIDAEIAKLEDFDEKMAVIRQIAGAD